MYLFLERGREGEREGEKHQCVVAFHMLPTGDLTYNPDMCSDWELNRHPLVPRLALNALSHTSQGCLWVFLMSFILHKLNYAVGLSKLIFTYIQRDRHELLFYSINNGSDLSLSRW